METSNTAIFHRIFARALVLALVLFAALVLVTFRTGARIPEPGTQIKETTNVSN